MKTIHAVYVNGVFRPTEPVDLPDKTRVEFEARVIEESADAPAEGETHILRASLKPKLYRDVEIEGTASLRVLAEAIVMSFDFEDGQICGVRLVANPDKLRHVGTVAK